MALVRADGTRSCLLLAACLLRWQDWHTDLTRPTWAVLVEQTGLSRRTVARWLRWLQDHDLLVLVQGGTTPRFAPRLLGPGDRNLAATYRLTTPGDGTGTPSCVFDLLGTSPRARGAIRKPPNAPRGASSAPRSRPPAADRRPSRRELRRTWHQQQARLFRERAPTLRRLSDDHLASRLRPFLDAGHTVEDLVHALDHKPDGTPHRNTDPVRCPAGWLRSRLEDHWRGPDGAVLPGHRQQLAARAAADRRQREAELDLIHCRVPEEFFRARPGRSGPIMPLTAAD